jgi:predicted transcriptional regulator
MLSTINLVEKKITNIYRRAKERYARSRYYRLDEGTISPSLFFFRDIYRAFRSYEKKRKESECQNARIVFARSIVS